jgi:hypothetical protein
VHFCKSDHILNLCDPLNSKELMSSYASANFKSYYQVQLAGAAQLVDHFIPGSEFEGSNPGIENAGENFIYKCKTPWNSYCKEFLLKGRISTVDLLLPASSDSLLFKLKLYFFYETTDLNEEVKCTEPSLSVRVHWSLLCMFVFCVHVPMQRFQNKLTYFAKDIENFSLTKLS